MKTKLNAIKFTLQGTYFVLTGSTDWREVSAEPNTLAHINGLSARIRNRFTLIWKGVRRERPGLC